jgi:DNA-binding NtrC family response regulator
MSSEKAPILTLEDDRDTLVDSQTQSFNKHLHDLERRLIGQSSPILETLTTIDKIKNVNSNVLLLGESGTGKEVVARLIHNESDRCKERFEAINCAAIPENLLESELFGHVKGSFTDAKSDRMGIFELCTKGTLMLDEIGDMPLALQSKLLRVLQERKVTPVGGNKSINIDTRVIAATHHDLADEIKSNRFREDLYYRLSVVVIHIPSLRQRKEDILLLVSHFLNKFNIEFGKNIKAPTPDLVARLKLYNWPGNVRELQNAVERGVVMASDDTLEFFDMFPQSNLEESSKKSPHHLNLLDEGAFNCPLTEAKQLFEKAYLESHLRGCAGNVAELARRAHRHRADLYRMFERYDINFDSYRN